MENLTAKRKLFLLAGMGALAFALILVSVIIFIAVSLIAVGFPFGGGIPSFGEGIILFVLVPLTISFAGSIPARALGATKKRAFMTGIVSMIVFALVEWGWGEQINYGLFSQRETLAYLAAIFVSVLISTYKREQSSWRVYGLIFAFLLVFAILRLVLPEGNFIMGFVISISAWVLVPLALEDSRWEGEG